MEPSVQGPIRARARLSDVRRRRRVVHGEAPWRQQQRQVEQLVQMALRRERHGHHGNRFHCVNRHTAHITALVQVRLREPRSIRQKKTP
jgi:hypothetical protein